MEPATVAGWKPSSVAGASVDVEAGVSEAAPEVFGFREAADVKVVEGSTPAGTSSTCRELMERRGPEWDCQLRSRRGSLGIRPGASSL